MGVYVPYHGELSVDPCCTEESKLRGFVQDITNTTAVYVIIQKRFRFRMSEVLFGWRKMRDVWLSWQVAN